MISGWRRSTGEGNGNLLQQFFLVNPVDREAWWATVHGGHKKVEHNLVNIGEHVYFSISVFVFVGYIPSSGIAGSYGSSSPREGIGYPLQYSCLENPHEQRSLAGYSPWRCRESDRTSTAQHSSSIFSFLRKQR